MVTIQKRGWLSALGFKESRKEDRLSLPLILLAGALVFLTAILEVLLHRPHVTRGYFFTGMVLFAVGFMLRISAQMTLGDHFSLLVHVRKDHRLVEKGVYNYIRHPMYTGLFMIFIGLCLAVHSIWATIAVIVLFIPLGLYRVRIEEAALKRKLGQQYTEYMKRTKRFVPFIF
ncbi:isoprenylcysteine carboxylmethyltransferase family protein [Candidatus Woesearchaeota archaeon]|nr:isoprenylcysteine carboxylmethyltransferase family protein [Candidatus Woesearchaeota archaeon]